MKNKFTLFLLLFLAGKSFGQDTIRLENPSFEDVPRCCKAPQGWEDPYIEGSRYTPVDIQPGAFDCSLPAKDGNSYLGMVVRDNNTWEDVEQDLDGVLYKDSSYQFSLYLAQSLIYLSITPNWHYGSPKINFITPAVLRVWGYNTITHKEEFLGQTGPVSHSEWMYYEFILKPVQQNCTRIRLEAYYNLASMVYGPYNGNLLVDNCSAIIKIKN